MKSNSENGLITVPQKEYIDTVTSVQYLGLENATLKDKAQSDKEFGERLAKVEARLDNFEKASEAKRSRFEFNIGTVIGIAGLVTAIIALFTS